MLPPDSGAPDEVGDPIELGLFQYGLGEIAPAAAANGLVSIPFVLGAIVLPVAGSASEVGRTS